MTSDVADYNIDHTFMEMFLVSEVFFMYYPVDRKNIRVNYAYLCTDTPEKDLKSLGIYLKFPKSDVNSVFLKV